MTVQELDLVADRDAQDEVACRKGANFDNENFDLLTFRTKPKFLS